MDFKIDTRKRVKITSDKIIQLKKQFNYEYVSEFLRVFCNESGLQRTSTRWSKFARNTLYYFKITDKQKYMLGKIKYGF